MSATFESSSPSSIIQSLLSSPISLFLLSLLLLAVTYTIYLLYIHPLSRVPGPFLASISRIWLLYHSWNGTMHRTMIALHARHGKIVRTGPDEVSISDLTAIKRIYGAGTKFRKSDWYSVWQGRRAFDLFPERDEGIHGRQRRLISGIYAMSGLLQFEGKIDEAIQVFMGRMGETAGSIVDLGLWLQLFAFDVVGGITFSKRFGFLEAGVDDGSFKKIEGALRSAAWVGQMPWIYWLNDYLSPILGNRLGIAARHGSIRSFAAQQVDQRKEKSRSNIKGDDRDILAKLFEVQQNKPTEMNDNAVLSMATSNVFAGSDTTAISLRSIIYYLLKNPQCKKRLVAEIDQRKKQGKLSDPMKTEEANEMPYLQACMYEALRLHPAVGMSLPRVVPEGGIEIDGRYLPPGTVAGVNPWVVHRNQAVFGNDVETFRPERWLEGDRSDMDRFFFAFGSGARMCLGRNISWMEMSKLVPTLFSKFELELADPKVSWKETCWWFVKQEGVLVKLHPRQKV